VAPGQRIVLDANILIRAVLGVRVKRIIIDHAVRAEFFAPEVAYAEANHHLPEILAKHDRGNEIDHALAFLERLRAVVLPVPEEVYEHRRVDALSRIESRDPDDWPVLAAALVIECPIWTEDKDFFGTGVPTWTTDRVELFLDAADDG
jgi:predicted nucleic acid-binding protein